MAVTNKLNKTGLSQVWSKIVASFVKKEAGKGLSANDYTTTEKNKLAGIQAKATYNDTLYKSSVASTVTVGGIAKGYTPPASGVEVKEMIDKLLHPYVAPSGITAQMLATNGGVVEKGTTQTITGVKVSWTAGSEAVKKIEVKNGSTTIQTVTGNSAPPSSPQSVMFDSLLSVATDTQLTVVLTDTTDKTYTVNTGKYTFVSPYYYGAVAASVTSPTASNIAGLTKIVQAKGNKSYNFTCNNQKMVYAYPKSYGALSKILDANSFDVTGTFTRSEVTVGGVVYYVYMNDPSTVSSFKMTFNY